MFDVSQRHRLLSERFVIEDCVRYVQNPSSADLNYSLNSLTRFKIEYNVVKSVSNSGAFLKVGSSSNSCYYIGLVGSGTYGVWIHTSSDTKYESSSLPKPTLFKTVSDIMH